MTEARTISPREKARIIQYDYSKRGTRAPVFSQTLAHGNGKNEIRQKTEEVGKMRLVSTKRSKSDTTQEVPTA